MKKIKIIYPLLALIALLTACDAYEGKEVDIDKMIKNKNNPIQYVIEGQISNLSKKQHIFISRPGLISGSKDYESVQNAIVEVSDGSQKWVFRELPKDSPKYYDLYLPNSPKLVTGGVYESEKYFAGKPGVTYTLKVVIKGEEFTAKETMPENQPMSEEEFNMLKESGEWTSYIFGAKKNAIWKPLLSAASSKENLDILIKGRINSFDRNYIGDTKGNVTSELILSGRTKVIERYAPTFEYSNYIWSYIFGRGGSVVSIEQNPHPSNFNNEKIAGYFSVLNCTPSKASTNRYENYTISYWNAPKNYTANYSKDGAFKLEMDANGQCSLTGKGETLTGSYDITNEKQMRVYFISRKTGKKKDLLHFYEETLKQAEIYYSSDSTMFFYRSEDYAFFDLQADGNLKTPNGVIWSVQL